MRSVALVFVLVACSGDPATQPPPACVPGAQAACACVGGSSGAQQCAADGRGYGVCVCPDASQPDVVQAVDAATVDGVPDRPPTVIYRSCAGTGCGVGLTCAILDLGAWCTRPCMRSADCADERAACVGGWCLARCIREADGPRCPQGRCVQADGALVCMP